MHASRMVELAPHFIAHGGGTGPDTTGKMVRSKAVV
jgi:hypothetical protein